MREMGIINFLMETTAYRNGVVKHRYPSMTKTHFSDTGNFKLIDFYSLFMLWFIGLCFAALVLFVERLIYNVNQRFSKCSPRRPIGRSGSFEDLS